MGGEGSWRVTMWTKIQINICSRLGEIRNDVLTIFIFYFYLEAARPGQVNTTSLVSKSAAIIESYQALCGGYIELTQ